MPSRKPKKFHLQDRDVRNRKALCGADSVNLVSELADVDCLRCHRLAGNKTTEQGGPKEEPKAIYLVLVSNGPNRIGVIRAIREFTGLGLKEAKDLSDVVQYGGDPVKVMHAFSTSQELKNFAQRLTEYGAVIRIEDEQGNKSSPSGSFVQKKVAVREDGQKVAEMVKAYKEMIRLWVPDKEHVDMLNENFDIHNKRIWPLVGNHPTVADVKRWLEAGGGLHV